MTKYCGDCKDIVITEHQRGTQRKRKESVMANQKVMPKESELADTFGSSLLRRQPGPVRVSFMSLAELNPTPIRPCLHPVPKGCYWSPDCERCTWTDCVVPENTLPPGYNSDKARIVRIDFIVRMRLAGVDPKALAKFMHTTKRSLDRYMYQQQQSPQWLPHNMSAIELHKYNRLRGRAVDTHGLQRYDRERIYNLTVLTELSGIFGMSVERLAVLLRGPGGAVCHAKEG